MKISAISRFQAIKLERPFSEKTAIISISNHFQIPVDFAPDPNLLAVLPLTFNDVDNETEGCMKHTDAVLIREFLIQYGKDIEHLVIHCNFGMCRSAAVAAAIFKAATGDDSSVFSWEGLDPNMHVYDTVLKELLYDDGKSRIDLGNDLVFSGRKWE